MAQQVTSYICPNCGGPVHFDAATGRVKCDYCDSIFTIEEVKKFYEEKNRRASGAAGNAEANSAEPGAEELGVSAPNVEIAAGDSWGGDASKLKVYHCSNCGAELITDETTAATTCPYCGNPTVIPGQFSVGRKPDYVIPFACEKEQALQKLQEYCKGKKLLPKSFTTGNHLEQIQGVYVPYWLFNGSVDADMTFECGKSTTTREGNFDVTKTRLYQVHRAGTMTFEKIPCDASSSMPDDLMDSVEPYDYKSLRKFELEYLLGYLANKYDVGQKDVQKKADERAAATACDELRSSISGYDRIEEKGCSTKIHRGRADYALMPVWLLYTKWNDKDFLFAMNGQTQKMTGNLPIAPEKAAAWFAGVSVAVFVFFAAVMFLVADSGNSGTLLLVSLVLALIVGGITVGIMVGQMKPVMAATHAQQYLKRDQSRILVCTDEYIRTVETRTPVGREENRPGAAMKR